MGSLFRVLLVVGFVVTHWWLILLILAAIGVGLALWLAHQRQLEAAGRRRGEHTALIARADQQQHA
jgi:type II secretory pathway component PulF